MLTSLARTSDKPFDATEDVVDEEVSVPKPVLEIIATVKTIKKRRDDFNMARSVVSDSDDGSYASDNSEDEAPNTAINRARMVIHSKPLINALNAVIGSYPQTNFLGDTVTIYAPYQPLVHYRDALSRYRIAQPASHDEEYAATTAKHIDVLLGYLDKTYGDKIREEQARHKRSPPVATSEWFWLLLKPGEVVYRQIQNVWTAFVIDHVTTSPRNPNGKVGMYTIVCWDIRFSQDRRMRRCMNQFTVSSFPGEQAIHTLEGVPAAFFPEDLQKQGGLPMAEKQIQMGRMYWELVKQPAYRDYDGQLVDRDGLRTGHVSASPAIRLHCWTHLLTIL